jgi:hypothetical protein
VKDEIEYLVYSSKGPVADHPSNISPSDSVEVSVTDSAATSFLEVVLVLLAERNDAGYLFSNASCAATKVGGAVSPKSFPVR